MNKVITCVLILVFTFAMVGCESGANVDGTFVKSYGLMSQDDKVAGVEYTISIWNAVVAILTLETLVVPIVYLAEYMYVPVKKGVSMQYTVDVFTKYIELEE